MQETTLTPTGSSTKRFIVLGTLFIAIMDAAFAVYLGFQYYSRLTSSWAGIYLFLALVGITITEIEVLRVHKKGEAPLAVFSLAVRTYITIAFLLFALAETLR